jgi:hypothetical protein
MLQYSDLIHLKHNDKSVSCSLACKQSVASLQPPAHAGSSLADFSTLKMEAHTRSARRHIPEDGILHSHRCENLKSYIYTIQIGKLRVTCPRDI